MKSELYICNTYYHLLISLIKCLRSKNKCTIMLSSDIKNQCLFQDENLKSRIENSKICDQVIVFNHSDKEIKLNKNKIAKVIYIMKCAKNYNLQLRKYDDIYIFYETCLIGRILNLNNIKYNLIEDGTDFYKKNSHRLIVKRNFKNLVRKIIKFYPFATSPNIKSIEVNDRSGLENIGYNLIEVPKKSLLDSLTMVEKEKIINIFLPNGLPKFKRDNVDLLITQPLSEDRILSNEKTKIELYRTIIKKYSKSDNILIKIHPRETTNYSEYFPGYAIIDVPFPIEIINFFPVKINRVITISSTSLDLIQNCNERIYIGWDFLKKYKER